MEAVVLRCLPGSRFHLGEVQGRKSDENNLGSTSNILHSDTLFSAMVNAWVLVSPETIDSFIDACYKGDFKLSSGFFMLQEKNSNRQTFFLPKPVLLNLYKPQDNEDFDGKKLKKVEFISKGLWESGLMPNKWFNNEICISIQRGTFIALKEEVYYVGSNIYKKETAPKVKVRYETTKKKGNFYYQTDLFIGGAENYEVSWYFLIESQLSSTMKDTFNHVLTLLVTQGIGGERSTGCGSLLGYDVVNIDFNQLSVNGYCSLSLVIPHKNETLSNSYYHVIKRGGRRLTNSTNLPIVQAMFEGAVHTGILEGNIVTLNENPKVLRYGKNLTIPVHENYLKLLQI